MLAELRLWLAGGSGGKVAAIHCTDDVKEARPALRTRIWLYEGACIMQWAWIFSCRLVGSNSTLERTCAALSHPPRKTLACHKFDVVNCPCPQKEGYEAMSCRPVFLLRSHAATEQSELCLALAGFAHGHALARLCS